MYLGTLTKALHDIDLSDVDMDINPIDTDISVADVSMEIATHSEPEAEQKQGPEKPAPENSSPTGEVARIIPVVQNSVITENKSEHAPESLWPSKLGAHTARQVLEVDMPIPAPWHENMAYTASTYIYLGFNFVIVVLFAWVIHLLVKDINYRVHQDIAEMLSDSNRCARDYLDNKCGLNLRRPALDDYCRQLEICMDRDPNSVFRLNAFSRALSEALNAFFDPLSVKSIVLLAFFTAALIYFTNFALGFIRARTYNPDRVKYRLTHAPQY